MNSPPSEAGGFKSHPVVEAQYVVAGHKQSVDLVKEEFL